MVWLTEEFLFGVLFMLPQDISEQQHFPDLPRIIFALGSETSYFLKVPNSFFFIENNLEARVIA